MKKLLIAIVAMVAMAVPARADEAELLARIEALEQRVAQLEALILGGEEVGASNVTDGLPLGTGTWIAGEDFPAGKYNMICSTGSGAVTLYKSLDGMREDKYSYIEMYMMGSSSYIAEAVKNLGEEMARNMFAEEINNIYIENGYCIYVEAPEIQLFTVQ